MCMESRPHVGSPTQPSAVFRIILVTLIASLLVTQSGGFKIAEEAKEVDFNTKTLFEDRSTNKFEITDNRLLGNLRRKRELRLKTSILSPRITTVQHGSSLNLQCVVQEHEKSPGKITWVINGTRLDFQTHRGGVHLELTRQKKSTTSKLTVHDFRHEDAGTYECRVEDDSSNELKDTLLSPSFKDSVEVRVVTFIKKEFFSSATIMPRLSFLAIIMNAIVLKITM